MESTAKKPRRKARKSIVTRAGKKEKPLVWTRRKNINLRFTQAVWKQWAIANFGQSFQPVPGMPYRPLIGMMEELGELAHAHLKQEQKIRGTAAEHEAAAKDAIGDLILYLLDYCNGRGWDADTIIQDTVDTVLHRNWKANPSTGVVEGGSGPDTRPVA